MFGVIKASSQATIQWWKTQLDLAEEVLEYQEAVMDWFNPLEYLS